MRWQRSLLRLLCLLATCQLIGPLPAEEHAPNTQIEDGSYMRPVGRHQTGDEINGLAISGNHAYLANDFSGLEVIDISQPAHPQRVGGYRPTGFFAPAINVAVRGNYAYVAFGEGGLQVIDVSDPTHPRRVGGHGTAGSSETVVVAGDYAYVADNQDGLQVIHIGDPANPRRVGGYDTPGQAWEVAVQGRYAYVADYVAGLQVMDISDPANPQRIGGYFDGAGDITAVVVSGHYAYLAAGTAGLHVLDISNPANPQRVGGYDTDGYAIDAAICGHYAYVADDYAGLLVIDIRNPANPQQVGGNTDIFPSAVVVAGSNLFVASGQDLVILDLFRAPDADGDGVPNEQDHCPSSDLSPTVVIGNTDSGVPNRVFQEGCTLTDLISALVTDCAREARNHGQFVSCVGHELNSLKKARRITGREKGALQRLAAHANPVRLRALGYDTAGGFCLSISGLPGTSLQLQRSTNLRDWVDIGAAFTLDNSATSYTDRDNSVPGPFFYRTLPHSVH